MASLAPVIVAAVLTAAAPGRIPEPRPLFDLATPVGKAESTWALLTYDRKHDELLAVHDALVHIYNVAGMESFVLGDSPDLGTVSHAAVLENGEMLLLTHLDGRQRIVRTDYRGDKLGAFEPGPMPEDFARFHADRIVVQGGRIHLVDTSSMRVVVVDETGKVEKTLDLAAIARAKDPEVKLGMNGYWVDPQGTVYFTMPYAFTAFVVPPGGQPPRQFGTRGSSPGKFNIVGAITTDEQGTIFVLDRLRSVVMVFTPELKFVTEFGYRGDGEGNLIAPYDLAVGNGKIFVSQARSRGVKVFQYDPTWKPVLAPGGKGG